CSRERLLRLPAERTRIRPRVERLPAVPAEGGLRRLARLQPPPYVFHLRRVVVDLAGGGQVVDELRRALVALGDLGGQRLHDDVRDLARDLAVAQLRGREPALGHELLEL